MQYRAIIVYLLWILAPVSIFVNPFLVKKSIPKKIYFCQPLTQKRKEHKPAGLCSNFHLSKNQARVTLPERRQ